MAKTDAGQAPTIFQSQIPTSRSSMFCHNRDYSGSLYAINHKGNGSLLHYDRAMLFLISAIAKPGLRPLGHVREQLRMVWQR
jgi:hypothetical protein